MRRVTAVAALELGSGLGEGARWEPIANVLRFVDCTSAVLHTYDPDRDALETRALGAPVAAVALAADGTFDVGTGRTGFVRVADSVSPIGSPLVDGVNEWLNDGRCDRRGRFWAGTSTRAERAGRGALYRLDRLDAPPARIRGGVMQGNGIGWSPDDTTMYFVDSLRRRLDAFPFDLDAGAVGTPTPLLELPDDDGLPDGIAVDLDGCVWVAMWGPGEVRRYTPDGKLDTLVTVAARNVTSCALAPDGLYITTARDHDEDTPLAGALFHVDVGVAGLPEPRFAG